MASRLLVGLVLALLFLSACAAYAAGPFWVGDGALADARGPAANAGELPAQNPRTPDSRPPETPQSPSGAVLGATPEPPEDALVAIPDEIVSTPIEEVSPPPASEVVVTQSVLREWRDTTGTRHIHVAMEVSNRGPMPVDLTTDSRYYTLQTRTGTVLKTGDFDYVFPSRIGPGGKAYFADTIEPDAIAPGALARLGSRLLFGEAPAASQLLAVSGARLTRHETTNELVVRGVLTNNSGTDVQGGVVGAALFDARGRLLAALADVIHIGRLGADERREFEATAPRVGGLDAALVKVIRVFAYDASSL